MRHRIALAVACGIALVTCGTWLPGQQAATPAVDRLVRDLDSDDFAVRDEAGRTLLGMQERALEPLKKALAKPSSVEFSRRAESLLKQLAIYGPGGDVVAGLKVRLT